MVPLTFPIDFKIPHEKSIIENFQIGMIT